MKPIDTMPHLKSDLVWHPHVKMDPCILGGLPHLADSRVPVHRLWAWHKGGASVETLIKRYPQLGPSKILDGLAFAYDNTSVVEAALAEEERLFSRT